MTTVQFKEWTCSIVKRQYDNGRVALQLVDDEGPVATATVNLPDAELGKNEVCVKDWSENQGMLEVLTAAGVVKQTGKTIRSGFVEVPICELQPPFREPTHAEGVVQTRSKRRVR
jgi:hypothetical protein